MSSLESKIVLKEQTSVAGKARVQNKTKPELAKPDLEDVDQEVVVPDIAIGNSVNFELHGDSAPVMLAQSAASINTSEVEIEEASTDHDKGAFITPDTARLVAVGMVGTAAYVVAGLSKKGISAQDQAIHNIQDYAQRNTDNTASQPSGTAPTVATYTTAGVKGVTDSNIHFINNILETAPITAERVNTTAKLQEMVDSYIAVLALADGKANNATTSQILTVKQISNLGIDTTGLTNGKNPEQRLNLLSNLLDSKSSADVDSVAKIQAMVKWVNDLSDFSAGIATAPAFTLADFAVQGVTGTTRSNLPVLLDEIKQSGAGSIDSLSDISALITKSNTRITAAFQAIQNYAQANEDPTVAATDTAPSVQNYQDVGVLRLDANNKDAVNSALTTLNLKSDNLQTTADIQKVVDAYNAVFALAEGNANNATPQQTITLDTLNNLGVNTTPLSSGAGAPQRLSLLNNVLDGKNAGDVNTVDKVNDLVKLVNALGNQSAGITPNPSLTPAGFNAMGVIGVTDANVNVLLDEIKQSGAGSIDSLSDISALITKSNTRIADAFAAIQNYAQANEDPTVAATGTAPSVQNYQDVGVLRLDANNKDAVNSALTTLNLKSDNLQTTADIQKVVDAYNAVFTLAEGNANNATPQQTITVDTLNNLGVNTTPLSSGAGAPQRLSLLNNVLDAQQKTGVNTITKVNDLVKYVNAVADQAAGLVPSYNMQAQDFAKLGIQGVDATNLADIQQSIAAQKNHEPLAGLAQLKGLVDFYKIAPLGVRLTEDTGIDITDKITRNGAITLDDTPEVGATLEYSVDGGLTYTSTYVLPTTSAAYTVWVRQVSAQGYLGKSNQLTFTYDGLGPSAPNLDAGILYFGQTDTQAGTNKLAMPNAAVPVSQDIAKIQLTLAGIDTTHDQWVLDGHAINLNGASQHSDNQSIAGVNVSWQYAVTSGGNHILTLKKNGGGIFSDTEVANIEKAMAFQSLAGIQGKRTVSVAHIDRADNLGDSASRTLEIDLTSPVLQLTASTASYTANLRATPGAAITGLTNGASVSDTAPIKNLIVSVKNVQDNERLVISNGVDASINLYGANAPGTANVTGANGGVWSWSYNSASSNVVFSLSNGVNASAAQASALLQALQYQNASTNLGHSGVRELTFTSTDAAGNISLPTTTTLNYVATVAKVATTAALDSNADGVLGDQFVVSFTELVEVNRVQNGNWTVANSVKLTPTLGAINVQAVDVQNIGGVDYAKHFWVKSAADSANWVVGQQQTFNFGNQTAANQQAYLILPTKTFGGDLTLEAWLYMDKIPGNFGRIFDLGTSQFQTAGPNAAMGTPTQGSDNILFGFDVSKKLFFQIYQGQTSQSILTTDTAISLNSWYHLAVTIDSSKMVTLYINGVVNKTQQFTVEANTIARDHSYINKSAWAGDGYLSGNIFDARVYNDARTADEIKNDFKGLVDPADPNQVFWYNLNGDLNSGLASDAAAIGVNATFDSHNPGTTFSIDATQVVDISGQTTATQVATLYKSSNVNGSNLSNNLVGTTADHFLTGQGGNDTLTGGSGRDVFAWLKGNTGADTVTDFKVSEGDSINLSSILSGTGVNATNAGQYLQWTQMGNNAELKIHADGNVNNPASKTITFIDGYQHGLNDTLQNLITQKVIVLG